MFLDRKKKIPTEEDTFVCKCIKCEPSEIQ